MGYLKMKHFKGMQISSGCRMDYLIAVAEVAAIQYEEEKSKERLIKEKVLKKPMTMPMDSPRTQGFNEEKIMVSDFQAQRPKNGLKRIYGSGEGEINFKINQKNSKYNNKKPTASMRLEKRQKLDLPPFPNPPPDMPEEIKNHIKGVNGSELFMVIQKRLTDTDLMPDHSRLSIPFGKINRGFLKERERYLLDQQISLEVPFYEPSHKVSKIILRQWNMGKDSGKSSSMYALRTHWNAVAKANGLKAKDVIQVWSFRVGDGQKLCLALVVVSRVRDLDGHGRSKMSDNEGASSSLGREKELGCGGSMWTVEDASTSKEDYGF
ncbi:B3 domain-containing protein At1g05920-like [Corylus avellana]|uniref:B3 domain-containing protein At1g05920-like n=1 Tax=Corylus avellana TaxID=13451 RepID=UPI00286C5B64|nr:B3 domain-containing protein At1g05920-like [Corylus avellana]